MNRRLLTILLVAFIIAAGCTFLVGRLINHRMMIARSSATTRIVAAKTDVKLGSILNSSDLTTIEVVTVPKGAILEKNAGSLVGRGVVSELYQGEPIIESRLAAVGSGGGLAATIPPGMRACAVKVDDVVNVSGFVTPGMRVDVLISGTPPGEQNSPRGTEARTLLQNIQVLSAGTNMQKDAEGKPKQVQVVNLLVTPEQAETLSLASSQLKIQLVLRNPLDTQVASVPGTATGSLFGSRAGQAAVTVRPLRAATPVRKAEPRSFLVEVINGSKLSQENFAVSGGRQ